MKKQISASLCMFQRKSDDYKHYIENVIVKLIIDNKIKNKIFF